MTDQNVEQGPDIVGCADAPMQEDAPEMVDGGEGHGAGAPDIPPLYQTIPSPPAHVKPRGQGTHRLWPTFLVGIIASVLGILVGASIVWNVTTSHLPASPTHTPSSNTTINVDGKTDDLAEAVSDKCLPSVVSVVTSYPSKGNSLLGYSSSSASEGLGSGVILTDDGYILTNYHVVEGASTISVTIDGTDYDATAVGQDESSDLAVIKIDATGLTPMEIGSSSSLKVGQWVATLGSPFGYEKSVATGIVSALYRSTSLSDQAGITIYANLIQTDASINPGNSGGALVDGAGKLIGITTLYSSSTTSSANVGFAIPVDYAYRVAQQIMDGQQVTHAYLGCSLVSVTPGNAQRNGLSVTSGAYIAEVKPGTAAASTSLQKGDVVVEADGNPVSSADELIIAVRSHDPGDTMELSYMRDGAKHSVTATLGSDADADAES